MKKTTKLLFEAAILAMFTLTGCESMEKDMKATAEADKFPAEDDTRSYRRMAIMQTAVGARRDGMLYGYHFDGDNLNSLGREKLSNMLMANDNDFPLKVYLNFAEDSHVDSRKKAVAGYLTDAGLRDNQMAFETGYNPAATSSASKNLSRVAKTESESGVAANPGNNVSGGAAPAASAETSSGK